MALARPAAGGILGALLLPADDRQATRIKRFLMAAGTSLLVCATLFFCAVLGWLPWRVATEGTTGILALIVLFYGAFRSGLNLRFADPSLTTEQCASALLTLTYIMYHAGPARSALALFYPVVMLFGVLRLTAARLMVLALLALAAHACMLIALRAGNPGMDTAPALAEFTALMIVLPWFAVMGGYVSRLRARVERQAMRDELTGVYNRRSLMESLAREIARAARHARPLCVALIDIDHFKSINDTLGHAAGDQVLRGLPKVVRPVLRTADILGRFGGEEFLIVLPEAPAAGAQIVAERVRAAMQAASFDGLPAQRRVTATIGVAEARPGEDPGALLARADRALYAGKAAGRNRVCLG